MQISRFRCWFVQTAAIASCAPQEDGEEMSSGEMDIPKETTEEEVIDVGALNEVQEQVFEDPGTCGDLVKWTSVAAAVCRRQGCQKMS